MADVEIKYNNLTIASLNDSGAEVLETNGNFLTDDITVEYTKPSAPTPTLQSKSVSYTPTTSQQTASVTADAGYDGLSTVNVTVNAIPSGTAGTPTATKGTVSNHSVSVTPSVTNTTGYITGGTKSGTAVTITAAELESGTKTITDNGTGIDVSGYSAVDVNVSGGGTIIEDGNGDIEFGKTGDVALITPLSVTENDTYTAPANTGYSPVNVNVSGGGGGYEDVTSQYMKDADHPDGHIFAYLNRATGEVIIGGKLNGGPMLVMVGGLPVESCFGNCTIIKGYYYDNRDNMSISNGNITMPSLDDTKDRVLFAILQAQGGGSIY